MNIKLVARNLGSILLIEAGCMVPSLLIALFHHEGDAPALALAILITAAVGLPLRLFARPQITNLRAREGFVIVGLAWVLMSVFGALPFVFSGFIPNFVDAYFEAVSGFTTTGSTVVTDFERMPMGIAFWRSFTHWIGGMGVLVLMLALLPKLGGRTSYLVKAESPGPSLSKVAPRMTDSAKILYVIYTILSLLMFVVLLLCGLNPFDAAIHTFGTAGTGGFSNYGQSISAFHSPAVEIVISFFMLLFGTNLALYYALFNGRWRDFFKSEELRWYLSINAVAVLLITLMILPEYQWDIGTSLRMALFNVATVSSTTGFANADYTLWPVAARAVLLVLMFCGSCTGSTAGGIKTMRIALMMKQSKREITRTYSPRRINVVRFEGRGVDEQMLHQISIFVFLYVLMMLIGGLLISLEGLYDLETNFTAALTCISNVGPGFGAVGPAGNFAAYGPFAKIVMTMLMLAGRLELFPILVIFHRGVWRRA